MPWSVEVYQDAKGWSWKLLSNNNRSVASSGDNAYLRRNDCTEGLRLAATHLASANVYVVQQRNSPMPEPHSGTSPTPQSTESADKSAPQQTEVDIPPMPDPPPELPGDIIRETLDQLYRVRERYIDRVQRALQDQQVTEEELRTLPENGANANARAFQRRVLTQTLRMIAEDIFETNMTIQQHHDMIGLLENRLQIVEQQQTPTPEG